MPLVRKVPPPPLIYSTAFNVQYFYLYCNEGRTEKVVLALSDSLYKRRVTTAGAHKTITKLAFRAVLNRLGLAGSGPQADPDLIFLRNQGVSSYSSGSPKFELTLDQFCDGLQMAAEYK